MRLHFLAAGCCLVGLMSGCSQSPAVPTSEADSGTSRAVSVAASSYPLAYALGKVGGARVAVKDLTPPGAEPHDVELTPRDVDALQGAGLIVLVGGGFQPSIEKAVAGLPPGNREIYDALSGLTPSIGGPQEHDEPDDGHGREGDGELDPHFWLDPMLMADSGKGIAERLTRIDPAGGDAYSRNSKELEQLLRHLDSEFKAGLKSCKRRTIIVAHAAFGYLASRYDLKQVSLSGLSPHAEPTPADLANARQVAIETGVTTVFAEPGSDAGAAETLAREIGGTTAELDPVEIQQPGKDYPSAMRANLVALRKALECD